MADISTDSLPPVQYLIMETLAARARLGEACWTFPRRFTRDLDALSKRGLLWFKPGVAPKTYMAFLTEAGRAAALSAGYAPPLDRETNRLREDVKVLTRNWHADRDKLVAVRRLAAALGDRSAEPRGTRLSDRRVVAPIRRMLYAILDGEDG